MDMPAPLTEPRPEPNGITPPLLFVSFLCMLAVPALALYALSRLQLPPARNWGAIGVMAGMGAYAVFSFFAGFSMYAGKLSGRNLVLWAALLGIVFVELVGGVFNVRNSFALTIPFIIALLWLDRAEVCRNNYNPAYRDEPIRPPLSPLARYGWLAWGGIIAVAAGIIVFTTLTAPDVFAQAGLSPFAPNDRITLTVAGEDITVPPPSGATHIGTEALENEGGTILLRFGAAGGGNRPYTMWNISLPDNEYAYPVTQEDFDEFRRSVLHSVEEINDVRIDDHPEFFMLTVKDVAGARGESAHVTTSFGFMPVRGVLLQCRMWRIASQPWPSEETAAALAKWMTALYTANQ